jgi:hypothetical protein
MNRQLPYPNLFRALLRDPILGYFALFAPPVVHEVFGSAVNTIKYDVALPLVFGVHHAKEVKKMYPQHLKKVRNPDGQPPGYDVGFI